MRRSTLPRCLRFCLPAILLLAAAGARGEDYLLTIGGGYSPQGNQVSLEKNVHFYQELLAKQKPVARHDIYFADGNAPGRDLQYADPASPLPKANRLMAEIFGSDRDLGLDYRSSAIANARGASSRENIARWFREVGPKLKKGDRLILYVTAHGGKSGDKKRPHNTKLYLWNRESIEVDELAKHLDGLAPGVQVVAVMVQCYSGGFAHMIFNGGDSDDGLSDQSRCGFFATVHDRPAAGCTPDIDEEDYHEYSSYFWAAILGRTRTGKQIEPPDYDKDGQISFDEAHGYVMLASSTIDIPVKTSDAFLREYSQLKADGRDDLVSIEQPFDKLLTLAAPTERAVLAGLARELKLTGDDRVQAAEKLAKEIEQQRKKLAGQVKDKNRRRNDLKRDMQRSLKLRWPELTNLLNPVAIDLLTRDAAQFVQAVESHPKYSEFSHLRNEVEQLENERFDLERRWVKCRRLIHVAENVVLAANLPKLASSELQVRHQKLLAAERGAFAE
jgi:hypothetical protein